ncbi:hypothetical protein [Belnapia moabensis]|uniref:hypothetical protein n=1 Tax=Belnapia moabensis TaxID=365533 RepID=UPI0005BB1B73|nr:hypothetical protein [Belnapia moabensis]
MGVDSVWVAVATFAGSGMAAAVVVLATRRRAAGSAFGLALAAVAAVAAWDGQERTAGSESTVQAGQAPRRRTATGWAEVGGALAEYGAAHRAVHALLRERDSRDGAPP